MQMGESGRKLHTEGIDKVHHINLLQRSIKITTSTYYRDR